MSKGSWSKIGLITLVVAISGLFVNCEVGLGKSVDTQPPRVAITYPPTASVIKNSFTVAGTAADETDLAAVTAKFTNIVTKAVYGPYSANINTSLNTWSVVVNPLVSPGEYALPDGSYELIITAKDSAGRTSSAATTYRIDNTAPVLVLDRPASVGPTLANADGFGSVLKVTGSANDEHAIEELVFTVYDDTGVQIGAPLSYSNISGVGMDIVLARLHDSPVTPEEINLDTIYRTIYDTGTPGTQYFYCTVDVSDEAREFNPPAAVASPTNTRGNINSNYYIYSKIYADIFSANGAAVTMRDLTSIFNGTYPDPVKAASVLTTLSTYEIDATAWSTASSTFSLNPEKSPKYELVGYPSVTDATIEDVKVGNESNITVRINEGLDKVPLNPDSFRILLRDLTPAGIPGPGPDIVLLPSVADLAGDPVAIAARNAKLSPSGGAYLIALNIGIVPTKVNYEVVVEGEDQDSVIIDNSGTWYGFRVVSNGKPPAVTITSGPANLGSVTNDPISFEGTVVTESGFGSFSAVIEIYDTLLNSLKETITVPAIAVSAIDDTWTYNLAARPEGLGVGLYAPGLYRYDITFTAVDAENNTTPLVRQIYMDNQDPTLQSFYFNNVVYESGFVEPRINGPVNTFSVQLRDNDRIATASYTLNGGAPVVVTAPESWTSPNIDSTAYPDDANIDIEFTIEDRAGNSVVLLRQIYVNQDTDRPVVTLSNLDVAITTQAGAITDNLLVGNFINGSITDDDAVASATITVWNSVGTIIRNALPITLSGPDGSKTFSYSVSGIADGQYRFVIVSSDSTGVTNTAMTPVWFSFDTAAPSLSASTPPANTNAGFSITGTASDTNALAATAITVTQRKDGGTAIEIDVNGPSTSNGWATWTLANLPRDPASIGVQDGIDASSDGVYEYIITAVDVANRTRNETRTVRFDATEATAVIVNPPASPAAGNVIGSSYTFTGTAADTGSGVAAVRHSFDDATWTVAAGTTSWNASTTLTGTEGARTLYVQTEDNAGNVSASVTRPFVYDTAIPVATITGAANRDVNAAFSLTGFATDNYGIASIAVTQDGALIDTNGVTTGGTVTNRSWTLSNLPRNPASIGNPLVADGTFVYNVTATDLAGKTSVIASVTVRVDTSAPNVNTIIAPGAGQTGVNALAGASYLFRGNASDTGVGVARVWYVINTNATAPAIATTPVAAGYTELLTTGNWSFARLLPAELPQGLAYYLHVLAEDSSGNRTATASAASVLFDVDLANPVAVENIVNTTNVQNRKAAFSLGGTAVDSHGIASVVVTQKLDDGAALVITPNGPTLGGTVTNRTWTLANLPRDPADLGTLDLTDGLYEYVITVTDLAGKTHSLTRTVRFDATGPTLTITAPAASSWANASTVPVNGVASDLSGIKAIYYAQGAVEPALPADWSADANWTGAGWSVATGTSSWSFSLTGLTEGSKRVWIRSVDTPINVSAAQSLDFGVDLNTPNLTASVPPTNTNAGFSITGTSSDTNALAATAITITQKKDAGLAIAIATNGPTTGDSWATWTLANLPRDPASIGVQDGIDASSDGVYEYVITVTDAAGKTSQVTRTVRFDATDATAVIVNPPASPAAGNVIGASYNFTGTAADTGSGVAAVRHSFDDATWTVAAGTTSWNASTTLTGTEGARTLYVQTEDNAGNVSASVTRPFVYDTAIPVATITGAANRDVNAAFSLTGFATDNYGIASIAVTQDGALIDTNGVTTGGTVTNRSWTLSNLPRNPASIGNPLVADGTFVYNVTATDLAGKTSVIASVTVRVDTSAPNVNTIIAPGAGQTGVNALAGASYLFRGNASDTGVGVARVWYVINTNATAPAIATTPVAAGYTELLTTGNWSFARLLPAELPQGLAYYLHVLAEDSSGNRTATASAASVLFDVDLANPVAVENIVNTTNVQNRKAAFSLGGTAVDSHGIASVVVTQKLDDGAALVITPNGPTLGGTVTNRTWTLANLPRDPADLGTLDLTDGLYEYVITVTDLAGKTHSLTRTVRFDATGPTLTITAPAASSWANASTVPVNGVASDLTGIKAIYYAQGAVEPALPADWSADANWTGTGWSVATGTSSWSFSLTGLTEGSKRVWIRSVDTPINVSAAQSLDFGVDLNTPNLTASVPPANTNAGFSITGTSSDTNALAATAITITQKKDAGLAIAIATNGPTTGDSWATWTLANLPRDPASIGVQDGIDASSDGVYEYVITVTDAAGKTSQVTRTVRFDLTLPTVVVSTDLTGWKGSPSLAVSGTAADSGSGVDLVEYSLDGTNWNALSGTTSWSGNIPVVNGTNTIRFRSRDASQNYSNLNTHSVTVDLASPGLTTTTPASLVRVNGQSNLLTEFHATDLAGSGVASVRIKIGSSDFTTPNVSLLTPSTGTTLDGTWNLTIAAADLLALTNNLQYVVYVQATDTVGNRTTVNFSILVDKVAPSVSITSPVNATTVNKNVAISGTASDTQGVASVLVEAQLATMLWETVENFTGAAANNWSVASLNTITYQGATYRVPLTLRATATDEAGNSASVTNTYTIDQDSDRPTVRLSNIDTDGSTTLINVRTVSGVLLDDDGTVALANFDVSEDGVTWVDATANPVVGPANPLFYDVETRSFQYSPSSGDGLKYLYFRVTDAAGTTFTTPVVYDVGAVLTYPKVQYSLELGVIVGTRVSYNIDTNPPSINSDIYFDTTAPYTFDGVGALDDVNRLLSNSVFGGTRSIFALRVGAFDAVGMDEVNIDIASTNYTTTNIGNVATYDIFTTSDIAPIDVSGLASGPATVTVSALDISGQPSTSSRQILIDNDDPIIDITSHAMNEQVTGDVILRGTSEDGTGSGIDTITYRVGTDAAWTPVTGTFSWNISFTGANIITTTGTYANLTHAAETSPGSNVWILPIYIRAIDRTGNETIETFYLNVNPDGDRPTVTVLYPTTGSTLGGTIRIFGSAQDNVSVASVWMMIDADGDGFYDADDVTLLTGYGYTVAGTDVNSWGFQISGTASWSQSINGSGEFNPPGAGQRTIRFRVRARDNNGTDGTWSTDRTLYVDNNVPRIGSADPLRLVQYTDGTFTTIAAERAYVSNMYIRGEWYLVGSVEDESGISAINVTGSDSGTLISEPTWFVQGAFIPATSLYNYTMRIPVGRPLTDTSTGQQSYSIYVEDGSDPIGAATQPIVLNYDNQAPVVDVLTHGGLEIDAANPIVQSNNAYTIASTVTEAGLTDSGFERLVFFFVRTGATPRVYNPMTAINPGQAVDDVTGNRTYLAELDWTAGDIPRLPVSGATRPGEDSLTHAAIVDNENVRVGGLVSIAGVDRLIKSVNRTTGNITFAPGANVSYTDASFAYGLVVDNTTIETGVWVGSTLISITNDDGDGMIESVVKSGGSYAWDASINSRNIPDGPIELRYVAYDKAGNSVAGVATTAVSNNRPRIARVLLGTDLSGDNAFSSTEISTYYTAIAGSEPSLVNLASASFIMKGRLAVIPEFVGGNGTLRYVWASNGAAADAWDGTTYPTASFGGTLQAFSTVTLSDDAGTSYTTSIEIAAADVTTMDDVLKLFSFAVWDETEETTQGTTSQWARLNVPVNVDVVDGVDPVVAISPFFWTDAVTTGADNSLYGESRNNGHIEIGLNALGDTDPKVSGSITIRGTAYDDQRLSALYAFIGANTGTVSTYAFTGAGATKAFGGRTYAQMATYDPASSLWTGTDQWATNGWSFTVIPDYQDQSGHKVDWELSINTARITNVAALNQLIRMVAEDRTPNASDETANPTGLISTNNVPGYQVDVVPYIRSIRRATEYNTFRSRQGRTGVRQGELLTFTGFNIFNTVTDTVVIGTASQTIPGTATNTGFAVTVPATARSGAVTVTVNSVGTLNNLNTNTNEYNTEDDPDNTDTALWNDDRFVHVWRSDDNQTGANRGYFAGSNDPEYPAMTQTGGVLHASWSNYATSSVFTIANNVDFVFATNRIASSYDPLEQTDIAFGNRAGVIYNANTFGNGLWNYAGAGGVVVWDAQADGADNVSTGNGYEVEYLYHDRRLMQFTNQRIDYQGNNIHTSYFDTDTKSLKYWYTASNGNVGYSARWINIDGGYDAHDGAYTERYGTGNTGASITDIYVANGATVTLGQNIMRDSSNTTYTAPAAGVVDIAITLGARISGTNTTSNVSILFSVRTSTNRVVDVAGTSRTAAAGEFSAIDTTPTNNFPVIAYYDITNRTLKLARATAVNPTAAQWTLQNVMSAGDPNFSFSGKYVSMKIDTLGYVHLAYFRNSTGDLIYTKSTNNPTNGATAYTFGPSVVIDTTGSVGVWADLTLVNDRPWISYLDSSYTYSFDGVKLAYYDPAFEAETGDTAGEPDTLDGWEYMNAALAYEVESVRTSIEPDGGANFWGVAIGYGSSDYYRIGYYVD